MVEKDNNIMFLGFIISLGLLINYYNKIETFFDPTTFWQKLAFVFVVVSIWIVYFIATSVILTIVKEIFFPTKINL